jgi:hypothetical protein
MITVNATTDYRGKSTDEKPTNADVNALLLEVDTGDFYYFDGENWGKVGGTTKDSGRSTNNTKSNMRTEPMEEIKAEIGEEKELDDRSEYEFNEELKKENTEVKQTEPEPTKGGVGE